MLLSLWRNFIIIIHYKYWLSIYQYSFIMLTPVAVLANSNPNYLMMSMPLPDRLVYATASIGILYDIS